MSMTNTHTTACGTEPFDKNYCIGYQVHHEDWSPFPRVNHLRQTFLDGKYWIDIERFWTLHLKSVRMISSTSEMMRRELRLLNCVNGGRDVVLLTWSKQDLQMIRSKDLRQERRFSRPTCITMQEQDIFHWTTADWCHLVSTDWLLRLRSTKQLLIWEM